MKKEDIRVEVDACNPQLINVNGRKFAVTRQTLKKIDGVEHLDRIYFKEVKDAEVNEDKRVITKAIKEKTQIDDLIFELLKPIPPHRLKRIANAIRNKKPIRVQHGCLGIKYGKEYCELIPAIGF